MFDCTGPLKKGNRCESHASNVCFRVKMFVPNQCCLSHFQCSLQNWDIHSIAAEIDDWTEKGVKLSLHPFMPVYPLLSHLSYMHSHFNYTFMYMLLQLGRPTSAPAHWLTGLSALCPTTHHPLLSVHHICIVTLTISTCTYYLNQSE